MAEKILLLRFEEHKDPFRVRREEDEQWRENEKKEWVAKKKKMNSREKEWKEGMSDRESKAHQKLYIGLKDIKVHPL